MMMMMMMMTIDQFLPASGVSGLQAALERRRVGSLVSTCTAAVWLVRHDRRVSSLSNILHHRHGGRARSRETTDTAAVSLPLAIIKLDLPCRLIDS